MDDHTNTDPDRNADATRWYSYGYFDIDADRDAYDDKHGDPDLNTYRDTDTHAYGNLYGYADANTDPYTNCNCDADSYAYMDTYLHTDDDCNAYANRDDRSWHSTGCACWYTGQAPLNHIGRASLAARPWRNPLPGAMG